MYRGFDIIATFSRFCDKPDILTSLIHAGVTGFRFSFSKEEPEHHFCRARALLDIASKIGKEVEIVMDLPGAKPRIMNEDFVEILKGKVYKFASIPMANSLCVTNFAVLSGGGPGDILVSGDGELAFEILEAEDGAFIVNALISGILTRKRALTIEGKQAGSRSLTDDEKRFLQMNFDNGQLFRRIYYSFADSAASLKEVANYCAELGVDFRPKIVPKIETKLGGKQLDGILANCDSLLIGRGDLGLQAGVSEFYAMQREAIIRGKEKNRRVIVGTQLFETATKYWVPNRAELSDLCHLLLMNIDGILLEAETVGVPDPSRGIEALRTLVEKYRRE